MKEEFKASTTFRIIAGICILIGLSGFIYGFLNEPDRTWANYLLNNYYFFSVAMGGVFFFVIQYISQSGWSAAFKRIPEAFMSYLPYAGIFFVLLYLGIHSLYHWSHEEAMMQDELIKHKTPYLNVTFFMVRLLIYFSLWIFLTSLLKRFSLKEDIAGGTKYFYKSEFYSRILIFVLAITFTLSAIDWIMSLSPHWYSTIFALKQMVSAFLHGVSIMILIIFILHKRGYYTFLNKFHLHDLTRYIFMLAIVWGYFWFAQFMLIWYGNIPEETVYYYYRWKEGWKTLFFAEVILNWAIPFFVLMPIRASRNMTVMTVVILFLIAGQYVEQYLQIIPETSETLRFGFIEIATFIGYAGLFSYVVFVSLGRRKIIPVNHPYLNESLEHHF
ncbi:MAG: quinol:cytochrome C oxidoreductase [Bacteroidota bacterium]